MSVLNRKLGRDLRAARGTLAAILVVIMVGIASFVGMASVYVNLEDARRDYYARCRMADFWIDLKKAPLAEVEQAAGLSGVAELRTRIAFQSTIDLDDVAKPLTGLVLSLPDRETPVVSGVLLQRGRWFGDEQVNEVIVNDAFARARRIRPGMTIHVILNNRRQALEVVGTAMSSEFVYLINPGGLIPDPESYGVLYVKRSFAEEVLDFDGACNQIVGLLTPDARHTPQPILDRIERELEPYGVFTTTPLSLQLSHQILSDELGQLRATAVILPLIFLAVAVLILNILMSRLAEQQRTTIGTLKALGYTEGELLRHYLVFGLLVGVLGGLLGLVVGYWLAQGLTVMYRDWFELPRLDNRIVPWVYVAALVISIGSSLLGTVRGVHAVVTLQAAEAMRPKPPVTAGAVWLERFRGVWRRLGFRWQMVVRSVWRHKWRTASGLFAACMGSALLFVTFYFLDSMRYLVDFQFEQVVISDCDLTLRDDLDDGALLEARRLPGVDHAEPLLLVACDLQHGHRAKRAAITGVTRDARLTVARTKDGTPVPIPPSGVVVSRWLADVLEVRRGDTLTVVPIKGLREPEKVAVDGVVDNYLGATTYADYDWLNRLVGEEDAVSAVQLSVRPGLQTRLDLYRAVKQLPAIQSLNDNEYAKVKLVTTLLDALRYSIVVLIGMAGVIFFGAILTNSLIAIAERQREIATFLVIGFEKRQVGGMFLRESLLVNAAGALLGLPVGFALAVWIISAHTREAYRLPLVSSPGSYAITMLLAVLFTIAAHLLVQRTIDALDWQEALNAKE